MMLKEDIRIINIKLVKQLIFQYSEFYIEILVVDIDF